MTLEEKVLSMRMNEFAFRKQHFFGDPDKDTFPNAIDIVKWEEMDRPIVIYSLDNHDYVERKEFCYVIGTLKWDPHEPCWELESCGMRFVRDNTPELNKWILGFCDKYKVVDGELVEVRNWRME